MGRLGARCGCCTDTFSAREPSWALTARDMNGKAMNSSYWLRPGARGAVAIALALGAAAADARPCYDGERYRPRYGDAEDCHFFAQEQAYRYAPPGAGGLRSAARGAVGGAVFGGVVGGGRAARRGALVGGALGAVANGARNEADRDYAYRHAYDDCMRGYRR